MRIIGCTTSGSVGTGFSDKELVDLHVKLSGMTTPPPALLIYAGDRPDQHIRWVEPALVAEVSFAAWSGEGRCAIRLCRHERGQNRRPGGEGHPRSGAGEKGISAAAGHHGADESVEI